MSADTDNKPTTLPTPSSVLVSVAEQYGKPLERFARELIHRWQTSAV